MVEKRLGKYNFNFKIIGAHAIVWLLFFSFILFSLRSQYPDLSLSRYLILQILILIEMLLIFYANYLYVAPSILNSRRYFSFANFFKIILLFFFGFCLSLIVRTLATFIEQKPVPFSKILESSVESIGTIFFFFTMSFLLRLVKSYNDARLKEAELKELVQQTKLEALIAKTNPHFLYNAFNTLYALSELKSDLMSDAILKLSNIMRYLLSNSLQQKVSIFEEIAFIHDFINFQKYRVDNPDKKIVTTIENPSSDFLITPTLLISFLENAFKHSNLIKADALIQINFEIKADGFEYYVKNSMSDKKQTVSGIGNENLRKILEIEYQGKYELKFWQTENIFHAFLSIKNL